MKHLRITYILRTDIVKDEENAEFTVYGITALNNDGKVLDTYSDIFFDKQKAIEFVSLCNSEKLELIHLKDVVEDALI